MNQNKHVEGSDSVDLLAELRYYFFFWSWYIGIMLFSIACTLLQKQDWVKMIATNNIKYTCWNEDDMFFIVDN